MCFKLHPKKIVVDAWHVIATYWLTYTVISWLDYCDVIMGATASQITSLTIVYSLVYSATDKKNFKAPRHWPLCGEFTGPRGIHRGPVKSPHKGPVTGKMIPFDDVIMRKAWYPSGNFTCVSCERHGIPVETLHMFHAKGMVSQWKLYMCFHTKMHPSITLWGRIVGEPQSTPTCSYVFVLCFVAALSPVLNKIIFSAFFMIASRTLWQSGGQLLS